MRTFWEALRQSFMYSLGVHDQFHGLDEVGPNLGVFRRFNNASAIIDFLHKSGGDLDEKDQFYRALIEAVQNGSNDSRLAESLLWLGLWPALDAIYRRRLRYFMEAPEELVSEIADLFIKNIHCADLTRINRIAATLVKNVERDIKEGQRRAWVHAARHVQLPSDDTLDDDEEGEQIPSRRSSESRMSPCASAETEIVTIRKLLASVVGDDADLVIGSVIYGENQREVGERLGLSHEAARKRYQRAMTKLRKFYEDGR